MPQQVPCCTPKAEVNQAGLGLSFRTDNAINWSSPSLRSEIGLVVRGFWRSLRTSQWAWSDAPFGAVPQWPLACPPGHIWWATWDQSKWHKVWPKQIRILLRLNFPSWSAPPAIRIARGADQDCSAPLKQLFTVWTAISRLCCFGGGTLKCSRMLCLGALLFRPL